MERRSWLWRRKSSEGETESSGGSISCHSDDQVCWNQSCEVTSKAGPPAEEVESEVKILSQKLSAALLNISVKEDLVKQHSKVAEEAVEGWEKAENQVLASREQVELLTHRNSTLEDRVCQLDGALKECLTQLRQTREEKDDQKKSENSVASIEMVEKENSALKLELASMAEELEIRFIERELSNQAAEQASKLHSESVKKTAKLEAECRRLNSALGKALATHDQGSFTDNYSSESNRTTPTTEINLMDDFLEMEKLVALPERDLVQKNMINQVQEMSEKVQELEITLSERENQLKDAESKAVELQSQLDNERKEVESQCKALEAELQSLHLKVESLETEVKRERALSAKMGTKCRELEGEISRLQHETQYPKATILIAKQNTELAAAASKYADCQKTIASLGRQLKTLATPEEFLIDTNELSRRI